MQVELLKIGQSSRISPIQFKANLLAQRNTGSQNKAASDGTKDSEGKGLATLHRF
jgi:hypothetical protein